MQESLRERRRLESIEQMERYCESQEPRGYLPEGNLMREKNNIPALFSDTNRDKFKDSLVCY